MRVVILGGGVTGLFTAYYFRKDSHEVTVIERDNVVKEASVYNAGLLTPSFAPTPQLGLGMLLSGTIIGRGALYFSLGQVLRNPSWYWTSLRKGLTGFEERTIKFGNASLELYHEFFKTENLDPDIILGVLGLYAKAEHAKSFAEKFGGRFWEKARLTKWVSTVLMEAWSSGARSPSIRGNLSHNFPSESPTWESISSRAKRLALKEIQFSRQSCCHC